MLDPYDVGQSVDHGAVPSVIGHSLQPIQVPLLEQGLDEHDAVRRHGALGEQNHRLRLARCGLVQQQARDEDEALEQVRIPAIIITINGTAFTTSYIHMTMTMTTTIGFFIFAKMCFATTSHEEF